MSLINAQPRFAYEPDSNTVFCYVTNRHYVADGLKDLPDGTWDLGLVKYFIQKGQPVEAALQPAVDKVAKADADFEAAIEAEIEKRKQAAAATAAPPMDPPAQ